MLNGRSSSVLLITSPMASKEQGENWRDLLVVSEAVGDTGAMR